MRISLLVQGAPCSTSSTQSALAFARAALAAGHAIGRVFFYKDAVGLASAFATDEQEVREGWRALAADAGFELAVCVSAAARRGVEEASVAPGFEIVGLGQLVEAMEVADRLVSF